jgi:hypothetical protein
MSRHRHSLLPLGSHSPAFAFGRNVAEVDGLLGVVQARVASS